MGAARFRYEAEADDDADDDAAIAVAAENGLALIACAHGDGATLAPVEAANEAVEGAEADEAVDCCFDASIALAASITVRADSRWRSCDRVKHRGAKAPPLAAGFRPSTPDAGTEAEADACFDPVGALLGPLAAAAAANARAALLLLAGGSSTAVASAKNDLFGSSDAATAST